jgi:serine/threonine-protein kinase
VNFPYDIGACVPASHSQITYRLVRRLHASASALVYEAIDSGQGDHVAMKFVRGDAPLTSMQRESDALERVRHPNVVRLLASGVTNDAHSAPYLVMPLLSGASLRVLLDRHRALGVERGVDIGIELFCALDAVHRKHIVHCDLRPENLFLERTSPLFHALVVLDFGLAGEVRVRASAPARLMGDPRYAAPDLFFGGVPSFASDLYAAGLTLFEILTGVHALPWTHDDWKYTHCFVLAPSIGTLLSRSPPMLTRLFDALLAKHADDRPPSAAACAETLRAIQTELQRGSDANAAVTTSEDGVDSLLRAVRRTCPRRGDPERSAGSEPAARSEHS